VGEFGTSAFACRRVRELVSLQLDGELTELEEAQLAAHLGRCPECADFRARLEPVTAALRAAPLEPLERLIQLPRRRQLLVRPLQVGAAAAAVAVATSLAVLLGPQRTNAVSVNLPYPHAQAQGSAELRQLQRMRRAQILTPKAPPRTKAGGRLPV
jgi:predicted anti-sigma-YlaC factor YlaD